MVAPFVKNTASGYIERPLAVIVHQGMAVLMDIYQAWWMDG